ncbi:MAG: hypothetical protein OCD01_00585 [Fibrobacterales bacterium]
MKTLTLSLATIALMSACNPLVSSNTPTPPNAMISSVSTVSSSMEALAGVSSAITTDSTLHISSSIAAPVQLSSNSLNSSSSAPVVVVGGVSSLTLVSSAEALVSSAPVSTVALPFSSPVVTPLSSQGSVVEAPITLSSSSSTPVEESSAAALSSSIVVPESSSSALIVPNLNPLVGSTYPDLSVGELGDLYSDTLNGAGFVRDTNKWRVTNVTDLIQRGKLMYLYDFGFSINLIYSWGALPADLIALEVDASEVLNSAISLEILMNNGYTLESAIEKGIAPEKLIEASYTVSELIAAGMSVEDLIQGEVPLEDLYNLGMDLESLVKDSVSAVLLQSAGASLDTLIITEYAVAELKESGVSLEDLIDAGAPYRYLLSVGFSKEDLTDAGMIGTFVDDRDAQDYPWVKIHGIYWMAENLNYSAGNTLGYCYGEADHSENENCTIYGRIYVHAELVNPPVGKDDICPDGWNWATDNQFGHSLTRSAFKFTDNSKDASDALGNPNYWDDGTDLFGFNGKHTGERNMYGDYQYKGVALSFWLPKGYKDSLIYSTSMLRSGEMGKKSGFPIRCTRLTME